MDKIKVFLKEYWVVISWLITVLIDAQYNILQDFGLNNGLITIIKVGGSALLAYMTKDNFKSKITINE
jgi:hypothetical protein